MNIQAFLTGYREGLEKLSQGMMPANYQQSFPGQPGYQMQPNMPQGLPQGFPGQGSFQFPQMQRMPFSKTLVPMKASSTPEEPPEGGREESNETPQN